jgi:uncharacterized protein YdiU (UPF0061 family)
MAGWNLSCLAGALLPLIADEQDRAIALVTASLKTFERLYASFWTAGMREKLGLGEDVDDDVVGELAGSLLEFLERDRADYTSFFRALSQTARGDTEPTTRFLTDGAAFDAWMIQWRAYKPDADAMERVNPIYIPRNHLVEESLAAATAGDMGPFERLLEAIASPYEERAGLERYAEPAPDDFGRCFQTFCGT